jgi:peptide/nickel transport system substrate-binding protein
LPLLSFRLLPAAVAALSCGGAEAPAPPAPARSLVIAIPSEPAGLLGLTSTGAIDQDILAALQVPVAEATVDCGLVPSPGLAKSWAWSADGRTLTLSLRDDLRWQDGVPVTAADVAAAWAYAADPAVGSPRASNTEGLLPGEAPRVQGPHAVSFTWASPGDARTRLALATGIQPVPAHALAGVAGDALRAHPLQRAPLANGPFRLVAWDAGQRLVLGPNPRWSGPPPGLDTVVFRVLPDAQSRLTELLAGTVDVVDGLSIEEIDRISTERPDITLHRRGLRNLEYIGWNTIDPESLAEEEAAAAARVEAAHRDIDAGPGTADEKAAARAEAAARLGPRREALRPHPLFGDAAVRRALSLAIDVDALIGALLTSRRTGEPWAVRATSTVAPALCEAAAPITPLPFDPAAARAALAAAGWSDSDGDGIVDKGGRPFRFRLQTNAENPRRVKAATMVQAQLKAVGVDAQLDALAFAAFSERNRGRRFDATLAGWSAALFVDPTAMWGGALHHELNFTSWWDPSGRTDAQMAEALATGDAARANPLWHAVQQRIYEDQPYTFLWWRDDAVAVPASVQGATVDLLGPWRLLPRWSRSAP